MAISPGISCSASLISARPKSARERSATLKSMSVLTWSGERGLVQVRPGSQRTKNPRNGSVVDQAEAQVRRRIAAAEQQRGVASHLARRVRVDRLGADSVLGRRGHQAAALLAHEGVLGTVVEEEQ